MRRRKSTATGSDTLPTPAQTLRHSRVGTLQWENELFRRALEGTSVIVFSQDRDLRYTWVYNPARGFSPENVIGKTGAEISSSHDTAVLTPIKQRVLDTGIP